MELGVTQASERIQGRLRRYIEAQYNIQNESLIRERNLMLLEPGVIGQRPYVEVTPSYETAPGGFLGLVGVPPVIKDLLATLSEYRPGLGVFPPYQHQAEALEQFFGEAMADLLVATGTGSGKTETFLYNILGKLALEGERSPATFHKHAVRALMLYPMNALVSDQTARLRRFLGDDRLAAIFRTRWGRIPRFGMYTSRTPYPGVRSAERDRRYLDPVLSHFVKIERAAASGEDEQSERLMTDLKRHGRWPAKDLQSFYADHLRGERVIQGNGPRAGRRQILHHWDQRLLTQTEDRELLTRHEMQAEAPDLLITNYSMLEYMLLRPIERSIFDQTAAWLNSSPDNQFLLVLDEAHMYRGVAGAEVGFLIRRLMSRLGIDRSRLRCILTSASLGSPDEAEESGRKFVEDLTGRCERPVVVIRGTPERRSGSGEGNEAQALALGQLSSEVLAGAEDLFPAEAHSQLTVLAATLGWPTPPPLGETQGERTAALRAFICSELQGFPPLEKLIEVCRGKGTELSRLSKQLFPNTHDDLALGATEGLLALGTFARRTEPTRSDQPLLPTRVHLMFRGLPTQHVCLNASCGYRRHEPGTPKLTGRLYIAPRTHCACGSRVFELLTHRDCGAAYVRAYFSGDRPEFLWHEAGAGLDERGRRLQELHLLLEEPREDQGRQWRPIYVDTLTGRVVQNAGAGPRVRKLYMPAGSPPEEGAWTFDACPYCGKRVRSGNRLKIMDLATKGEQPFANLVREQFACQPKQYQVNAQHPSGGRKALLFSDGRQKAARLARDLPREVEMDSIREALVLACRALEKATPSPTLADLYAAFLEVCANYQLRFFDSTDQNTLLQHVEIYRSQARRKGLPGFLERRTCPAPPVSFRLALARQLCDPYYSLIAACAVSVSLSQNALEDLLEHPELKGIDEALIEQLCSAWILHALQGDHVALDPELDRLARRHIDSYWDSGIDEAGMREFLLNFREIVPDSQLGALNKALFREIATTREGEGGFIRLNRITMHLALESPWVRCSSCYALRPTAVGERCSCCGSDRLQHLDKEHPLLRIRKGFFREPLFAVLRGEAEPFHITAEEHTAQLSQRDVGDVWATTEEFELRFQDVTLSDDQVDNSRPKLPIDVLSCTTTMEVGIDIGSLTAVGLRTVPPQRENYQQRAGRAGRRGTSVSTVITFAQGGAHDAHYFAHPMEIISGAPRKPKVEATNRTLARRHINSFLLQTFFHRGEGRAEQNAQLFASLGTVAGFCQERGPYSLDAFRAWLKTEVLTPGGSTCSEAVKWLPVGIAHGESLEAYVQGSAEALLESLEAISKEFQERGAEEEADPEQGEGRLLEKLFAKGVLPSYAFPTDLCSFVIQRAERGEVSVEQRPQQSKGQALSEYAPGRLLVVNKKTYRVGGILFSERPSLNPAEAFFQGDQGMGLYIGCPRCSYVRLGKGDGSTGCPICKTELVERSYLNPPGFLPEEGRALPENESDQEITFATSAQLPEVLSRDGFQPTYRKVGALLETTRGSNVELVVMNKGVDGKGFAICGTCGAAHPEGSGNASVTHRLPFLLPHRVSRNNTCSGSFIPNVYLGYTFKTDLLLLRFSLPVPLVNDPLSPWLQDALLTLAESLVKGATLTLDIDPGELAAGYRFLTPLPGAPTAAAREVEIFLYDTAAGGAGYSSEAEASMERVLDRTERLLSECRGKCETSCTECLRHYGNRFVHERLDRRLALYLLQFLRTGTLPALESIAVQHEALRPLRHFLELEGAAVSTTEVGGLGILQVAEAGGGRYLVGAIPSLLSRHHLPEALGNLMNASAQVRSVEEYLIRHDLPAAVRRVRSPGAEVAVTPTGLVMDLEQGAYNQIVPSRALADLGYAAGQRLVLQPINLALLTQEDTVFLRRKDGECFRATEESWTIGCCSPQVDERVMIKYPGRTERRFRPEVVPEEHLEVVGRLQD